MELLNTILGSEGFGMLMTIVSGMASQQEIDDFNAYAQERIDKVDESQRRELEAILGEGLGVTETEMNLEEYNKYRESPEYDPSKVSGSGPVLDPKTGEWDRSDPFKVKSEPQLASLLTQNTDLMDQAKAWDAEQRGELPGITANAADDSANIGTKHADRVEGGIGRATDIEQYARDRYRNISGYLSSLGAQQTADLNQRYDNLQTQQTQNLMDRGLSGTTITSSVANAVEEQRGDEMNRLNDRLNREKLDYHSALSADVMNAQQGGLNTYLGVTGDQVNSATQQQGFMYGVNTGEWGMANDSYFNNLGWQNNLGNQVYGAYSDWERGYQDFQIDGQSMAAPLTPGQMFRMPDPK